MNRLLKDEPFRPVRSDYAREVSYARRRFITVIVLILALSSAVYAFWSGGSPESSRVPTIGSTEAYKEKPEDPGGIDVPHRDVLVYDQLEGKKRTVEKERLLPPPEEPQKAPETPTIQQQNPSMQKKAVSLAATIPAAVQSPVAPVAEPAKALPPIEDVKTVESPIMAKEIKALETVKPKETVLPKPVIAPKTVLEEPKKAVAAPIVPPKTAQAVKPATAPLDSVFSHIQEKDSPVPVATGGFAVQLTSVRDEGQARQVANSLKKKYADLLGGTDLYVRRANLGSRGVFYRIQSDFFSKDDAARLCSSLKKRQAECFLVRR
ncbi:MAG: SPOR domain-containing protein [Alphaproteobacteria bacterium]|nr:SPOR domain-containing protein [Alphaproteobacteria bacterium]